MLSLSSGFSPVLVIIQLPRPEECLQDGQEGMNKAPTFCDLSFFNLILFNLSICNLSCFNLHFLSQTY